MEPTQDKPARKRRRWLIVAFVLVLVSLCSWSLWPRVDARFVGKWLVKSPRVDEADGFSGIVFSWSDSQERSRWSSFKAGQILDLRADGTARLGGGTFGRLPMLWKISHGHLKFVPNRWYSNISWFERLRFAWDRATDRNYSSSNAWPIRSILQNELQLQADKPWPGSSFSGGSGGDVDALITFTRLLE